MSDEYTNGAMAHAQCNGCFPAGAPDVPEKGTPTCSAFQQAFHATPGTLRYLACDGCGEVTLHSADRLDLIRQAACDQCGYAQIRTVGDEAARDATVMCAGRRWWRWQRGPGSRPCEHSFPVPSAARTVVCPWCSTVQPSTGSVST